MPSYAVLIRRRFYAGTIGAARGWRVLEVFATRAGAARFIRDAEAKPYHLAHGETGRPELRATRVGSTRHALAARAGR